VRRASSLSIVRLRFFFHLTRFFSRKKKNRKYRPNTSFDLFPSITAVNIVHEVEAGEGHPMVVVSRTG
jgi:hypothetical protein